MPLDLLGDFDRQLRAARVADPDRAARAGLALLDGALRVRTGNNGLYPTPAHPVTKPVESLGAWIESLRTDAREGGGDFFHRENELREVLGAAAAEVDAAVKGAGATPSLERLRAALYQDALGAIEPPPAPPPPPPWYREPAVPWVLAGGLGGVLLGLLIATARDR